MKVNNRTPCGRLCKQLGSLSLVVIGFGLTGCNELLNDGGYYDNNYQRGGYYDSGYGNSGYGGYNNGYYDRQAAEDSRRERDNLERERRRVEEERRRLEDERNRQTYSPPPPPPAHVQRAPERCPAGFSPSENKCSREERRRGCRDMRLPGGLGCVSR